MNDLHDQFRIDHCSLAWGDDDFSHALAVVSDHWSDESGLDPRLNRPERDRLNEEDRSAWDFVAETHSGRVDGPFAVMMHVPELARRVAVLETFFRSAPDMSRAEREIVTLTVAREAKAAFAWTVHERAARAAGVRDAVIETIDSLSPLEQLAERERLLVEVARSLSRTRLLDDDLYARAVSEFGEPLLIEIVALVGHYGLIGLILNSFQVPRHLDSS